MFVHKPIQLGKLVNVWVADTLGEYKPIKGEGRKWPKYRWPGGCQWHSTRVPSHPHVAATLASALCNPWTPTRLQPYAQNSNPTHKERHPKATKSVEVNRSGRHGNRLPYEPGHLQHLPTYNQTVVVAAVWLRVLVIMAVDTDPAIFAKEG